MNSTTFEQIRPTGTPVPRMYGLPKAQNWSSLETYSQQVQFAVSGCGEMAG